MTDRPRVLVVGVTTLDVIDYVDSYPVEDSANRTLMQKWVKGGNAANTACVLSQLNVDVDLLSTLSGLPQYKCVIDELQKFKVNIDYCTVYQEKHFPVCTCVVNLQNGSRTFIYSKNDLPWISVDQIKMVDLSCYDLVHFEGRTFPDTGLLIDYVLSSRTGKSPLVSAEMELVADMNHLDEHVLHKADIVFINKDIAKAKGYSSAKETVHALVNNYDLPAEYFVCPWGEYGAAGARKQQHDDIVIEECEAYRPDKVIDTLGAGDTFIAGALSALLRKDPLSKIIMAGCKLAGEKCGQVGYDNLDLVL